MAEILKGEIRLTSVTLLIASLFFLGGCVKRVATIDSYPQGAKVFVQGEDKGSTPCSFDFRSYGTYRIKLVKEGYEDLITNERLRPPLYEFFPLDFIFELLYPRELEDGHRFVYKLTPQIKEAD